MKYKMMVISRIETDDKSPLIVMTLYPTANACIKPRAYEKIQVSYACVLDDIWELADALSDKGKRRLKIVLKRPYLEESERRALGSSYYSLLFGRSCGNDEAQKGIADSLYQTMTELYAADDLTEDGWATAANEAVSAIRKAVEKFHRTETL